MPRAGIDGPPCPLRQRHNFRTLVQLDGKTLRVTTKRTQPDPAWPDRTMTSEIAAVSVNREEQFVVTGAWRVESAVGRPPGTKVTPSDVTYAFWPVSPSVVWFDQGAHGRWVKLRRK
ncbi:MAG: hypothetical protein HS104_15585 [Polyangiaceae bacterium]|nr:hypothetical protein [Polyangiaceae bacterium]MCE7889204.1 hypothetical protein [Sorangiineae bacterium PRO1]MCL4755714.1 hypothetical protein [Myxococcales bacterium]